MSERPTDWTSQPETDLFTIIGTKKGKHGKKRTKNIYAPWAPGSSKDHGLSVAGPGIAGSTTSKGTSSGDLYTPSLAPGRYGGTTPGGGSSRTSPSSGSSSAGMGPGGATGDGAINTAPRPLGGYDTSIGSQVGKAPAGSLAAGIGDMALDSLSKDPYSIVNEYYQSRGMQPDSNIAQLATSLYNPGEKVTGILGNEGLVNPADAVNFGAALVSRFSQGGGEYLDGVSMVKTALSALANEMKNPGQQKGAGGMLTLIAMEPDPRKQLASIMSIIDGILKGTMPADSAAALYQQLQRAASGFTSAWSKPGAVMGLEKGGQNIASSMLNWLEGAF